MVNLSLVETNFNELQQSGSGGDKDFDNLCSIEKRYTDDLTHFLTAPQLKIQPT